MMSLVLIHYASRGSHDHIQKLMILNDHVILQIDIHNSMTTYMNSNIWLQHTDISRRYIHR